MLRAARPRCLSVAAQPRPPASSSCCAHHGARLARLRRRAASEDKAGGGGDDSNIESLFAQELKRRGISSKDNADPAPTATKAVGPAAAESPFKSSATQTAKSVKDAPPSVEGQRERSVALVNEGLEGLIPRASELLKLGASIFLAFAPFILAISLLFGGIYSVFGEHFVHGGDYRSGPPVYIDPEQLLSEPTVDPYIPTSPYLQ